jgi:hypothetical protein
MYFSLVVMLVDRRSLHRMVRSNSTGTMLEGGPRFSESLRPRI